MIGSSQHGFTQGKITMNLVALSREKTCSVNDGKAVMLRMLTLARLLMLSPIIASQTN